jgi:hypothetical protein
VQLSTFVSNLLVQFWVKLKQQILEGFVPFTGMLICVCSGIVVHFAVSLSLV